MAKLTSDAKFEVSDIKASVAAIAFILSSAAKHSVDGNSLDNEMQQLGLPKGNYMYMCICVSIYHRAGNYVALKYQDNIHTNLVFLRALYITVQGVC